MRRIIEQVCKELMLPNLTARVLAVDKSENTCDVQPLNGGAQLLDVKLRADDGKTSGQIIYPAKGSLVLIAPVDNDAAHYFVVMFSEVDEVVCQISGTRMIAGETGVVIAQGNDGLREVLVDMVDEVLKIYAPMNKPGLNKIKGRIKQILNGA